MNNVIDPIVGQALQHLQTGNAPKAEAILSKVIQSYPRYFPALHILGLIKASLGKHAEAANLFKKALRLNSADPSLHYNLAKALQESGNDSEALLHHKIAVKGSPLNAEAWLNYGKSLSNLGFDLDALGAYNKSLEINPNYVDALSNQGAAFKALKRYEEALAAYDKALYLNPNFAEAWLNKGVALKELQFYDQAVAAYDKALYLNPNFAEASFNKGILKLYQLDFSDGWPGHELRWIMKSCNERPLETIKPRWDGQRKKGRLLIWGEQGIGDQILFSSILSDLKNYPQKIIVTIDKRLISIFSRSFPEFSFIDKGSYISEDAYDEHLPIASLGLFFRKTVSDFQLVKHPYLYGEAKPSNKLYLRPSNLEKKLMVGLSWSSQNPILGNDKSVSLRELVEGLNLDNTQYINLQYGKTAQEISDLNEEHRNAIFTPPNIDTFNDIEGLINLIETCDLIVTVCNTTAHLAGAIGKEVLLLTPFSVGKFWYWQDIKGISLFYPSVKTFKQINQGDWTAPINEIKTYIELRKPH